MSEEERESLIAKLQPHLDKIKGEGSAFYVLRFQRMLSKIKRDEYKDEELKKDLNSFGFYDLSKQLTTGIYV